MFLLKQCSYGENLGTWLNMPPPNTIRVNLVCLLIRLQLELEKQVAKMDLVEVDLVMDASLVNLFFSLFRGIYFAF